MASAAPDCYESKVDADIVGEGISEEDPLLPGKGLKQKQGWLHSVENHFGTLGSTFGHKILFILFVHQHLHKGFLAALQGAAVPYIYKAYKVPAPQVQIFGGVVGLPWAMKPIIGLMSDLVPIAGYNKVPYIVATSLVGISCVGAVGFLNPSALSITALVVCFFLIQLQASTGDLLSEAKYAEKIQDHPSQGSSLLTYVWFGMQVGGLAAVLVSGHIINLYGPKSMYKMSFCLLPLIFIPAILGFWGEKKKTSEEVAKARQHALENPEACFLCAIMLVGTITLSFTGIYFESEKINCCVGLVVMAVVLTSFSVTLSPVVAKINAFALLQSSLSLPIGGAAFYFFTDTAKQYPEGPHFSPTFYNTIMGTAGSVCSLLGILFYNKHMSKWKYRDIIIFTNLVLSGLCLSDAVLFARLNVKFGIPDTVFVMGSSTLESVVFQWQWMPHVVIMSYLCPKGMEATMYALLAGCANLGNTIAANCGALMIQMLGCEPSGSDNESDQFKNLWIASLIGTFLPFITCVFTVRLLPDVRQNEKILEGDAANDPTAGSVWRTWRNKGSKDAKGEA